MNNGKKLTKSQNKMICGVCSGIAEYFDMDVSLVRLITLCLIAFAGLSIWVYIVAAIILPEPETYVDHSTPDPNNTFDQDNEQ